MQLKTVRTKMYVHKRERVNFLGHVVSSRGIETDPPKIEKIKNWPPPSNSDDQDRFWPLQGTTGDLSKISVK